MQNITVDEIEDPVLRAHASELKRFRVKWGGHTMDIVTTSRERAEKSAVGFRDHGRILKGRPRAFEVSTDG
jgi:hypothetical protein